MKLSSIRSGKPRASLPKELGTVGLFLLLGAALGLWAKWMDTLACGDGNVIAGLLLRLSLPQVFSRMAVWALIALAIAVYSRSAGKAAANTFGFFVGMLAGYYLYTIRVVGFFPRPYMIAWGLIALATPLLAALAWYACGRGWVATLLSAAILGFFFSQAFGMGRWYCDLLHWQELLFLPAAAAMLYSGRKKLLWSALGALLLAPFIEAILPYIVGGL